MFLLLWRGVASQFASLWQMLWYGQGQFLALLRIYGVEWAGGGVGGMGGGAGEGRNPV